MDEELEAVEELLESADRATLRWPSAESVWLLDWTADDELDEELLLAAARSLLLDTLSATNGAATTVEF